MTTKAGGPIHHWTLRRRLALLFGGAAAAVVLSVALSSFAVVHLNATVHRQVDSIDPAQVVAEDLFNGLVDQETGERGYVISRNVAFLQPYASGLGQETSAAARLRSLLKGDASLNRSLSVVLANAAAWQQRSAVPTIIAAEAGRASATAPVTAAAAKARFDAVRTAFIRFRQALADQHQTGNGALSRADVEMVTLLGVALVALLVALELLMLGVRRWVSRPLARLVKEVRTVSSGELTHGIAVAGPPELRSLGDDIDAMRRRILVDFARLQAANEELDHQADALRRSNSDLEQFAYVASHDLQEPLRKMAGFSELLERRYGEQLDERGREYLTFVADGARRMQQLINDVLELSRVGRASGALVPVNCRDAARAAAVNLAAQVQEAGATIVVGDLPSVMGNPALLVALFQNLFSNSLKFRSEDPPHVVVESVASDGRWVFSVRDNGIGVDARFAEQIFAMFQRLHPRDRYGGTGIGLALCKRIVEHLGGSIWLEPSKGSGTTISWSLAALDASNAEGGDGHRGELAGA